MSALEVKHSSESVEWMTPPWLVDGSRTVMGGIDLDPASCALSEPVIRAHESYDVEENGFIQPWFGRVLLNPPGGWCDSQGRLVIKKRTKEGIETANCMETGECGLPPGHQHDRVQGAAKAWWAKLARAYVAGEVEQAIFVGFNMEILQTTLGLRKEGVRVPLEFPLFFPEVRVRYYCPNKTHERLVEGPSPPHASVIVFLPPRTGIYLACAEFKRVFEAIGGFVRLGTGA